MLDKKHVNDALEEFARDVIKQARKNLKSASGSLSRSLNYRLHVGPNSFDLEFEANSYADFHNQGVSGKDKRRAGTKYRFGTGSFKGSTGEDGAFDRGIRQWIKLKGIRYRDKKGRYAKNGLKSLSYLIRRKIYSQGIRPSLFFTKSFERYYKKLPDDIIEAYALDVTDMIQFTFKTPQSEQYKLDNII